MCTEVRTLAHTGMYVAHTDLYAYTHMHTHLHTHSYTMFHKVHYLEVESSMLFVYSHISNYNCNSRSFPHHIPLASSLLSASSNCFLPADLATCISHRWIIYYVAFHD